MTSFEQFAPLVGPAFIVAFTTAVATKVVGSAWIAVKAVARALWWIAFGWWLRALWNRYIG
jgi:hypothetical protein